MIDYKDVLKKIGLNFRVERAKKSLSQERFAELALTNALDLSVENILTF